MKKLIMMLLGVVFATGALADSYITAYEKDTQPGVGNGSWYSCYCLGLNQIKAATGNQVTSINHIAFSTWLQANFAANKTATMNNALYVMPNTNCQGYDAQSGQYQFIASNPEAEENFLAVCFFDNSTDHAYQVVAMTVNVYTYMVNDFDNCYINGGSTGWIAVQDPIDYLTWDASKKKLVEANTTSYTVVTKDTATFEDGKWYVVDSTIERGKITVKGTSHLILCDGASLTVTGGDNEPGIAVAGDGGKSLTIYGQANGTGTLIANGGHCGAGIGSVPKCADAATITINGGTIKANGAYRGAGIGGSELNSSVVAITINGGEIEANGGQQAAGIGSGGYFGYEGSRSGTDSITINGGTIKATAGQRGAGIGSGVYGFAVTVTINGGSIEASSPNAPAIGSGVDAKAATTVSFGADAELSIMAGDDGASATETTVAAYKANHSAKYVKIEGGDSITYLTWDENEKKLVEKKTTKFEVVTAETATFEDGKWYVVTNTIERAGIKVDGEAHLILCDGAKLKVTGGAKEAGIEVPADKSLTIYGQSEGTGKLEANGGNYGAGIGGKNVGTCGTITINGGTIKANGGNYGAGIGSGDRNTTTVAIVINGGEIEATGGDYGAGIGSGSYVQYVGSRSGADTITLNGGVIKTIGGFCAAGIGNGAIGLATTVTINGGTITASTTKAQAIGSGYRAVSEATVTFGTALASTYVWAGESATKGETMTTTAFAADHSAAYAELPVETYEVAYGANGATGTMSNSVFAVSREMTLKKNAFTALGYDFAGWTTNGTDVVYADEAKSTDFATTNATLTLYAKWNASTNSVTATDFSSFTNMLATAKNQGTNLGVTIGFDSGVKLDGATITLPASGTTGFEGLKYEDSTKMWLEDGVLYADKLRGDVTVDALQLMKLANGGTTPTSFKVITEGDGTSVTNDVIMLLGSDRQQYCNDEDDVAQMIDAVLAASPRPETVTLCDVKETIVSFTDFTDGKDYVYEVNEGETAKIAIAGGSKTSAVQATLYCVSKSSDAIKTTSSKVTTTAVNSSVINLLARINPAAALMMLQSSSTATTVVPGKPQIYVDGKRVNFPITLNWEKGDTEPKIVEIVTVANKAVKPDRYVRLQLGASVGCKIVTGSDYAQLTIKDGGPDPRREVTASIYPTHAGKVAGAGFLKNEKSVITLTAKPAACSKTATFKGWFKAAEGKPTDVDFEKTPVSTELKFKVGYEDFGHYVAYFEEVLPLPQAIEPEVFKDGQIVEGVEGVVPADKDNSMLMLLVGAKVSLPISFSEETTGVTGVTAKGLPNGLKVAFDKKTGTCVITGKPTKRGTFFATLTIKNAAGSSTLSLNFAVNSLAGRAIGLGRAEGTPNSNIDMTIGSSGSVSAKINVAGVYKFSFSAKNLNYTCDNELNPIISIDLTNSKYEMELPLIWNSEEAAFEGEFMKSKFKAILLDSGSKTVATYTDKIFDSDKTQIGTIKVVVKESGLATITGKIDGNSFSTFGYAEEIDGKDYSYMTEFYAGSQEYYFFSEYVELYDEGECQILGRAAYQSDVISDDDIRFGKPSSRPE